MTVCASVRVDVLTIWDAPTEPPAAGVVYLWKGRSADGHVQSLLSYVEANADRLRDKFRAWIYDVGDQVLDGRRVVEHLELEPGFSFWWLTRLAEQSAYKSPVSDGLRLLAIEELLEELRPRCLKLVTGDARLVEALAGACRDLGVDLDVERSDVPGFRPAWWRGSALVGFRALAALAGYLRRAFPFRGDAGPAWASGGDAVFICSYFDNVDVAQADQGTFRSAYWAALPERLRRDGRAINWLQIFVPCAAVPDAGRALGWIDRFNRTAGGREVHRFVDGYFSVGMLVRLCRHWLALGRAYRRLARAGLMRVAPGRVSLWPVMRSDWLESMRGPAAIEQLWHYAQFDAAMAALPQTRLGLVLFENQGWERAFTHVWRKHGHGRLIGVPHSTVRYWDLRYWPDARAWSDQRPTRMPRPDVVAVNGEAAAEQCRRAGYPAEELVAVEALRYAYLEGFRASPPGTGASSDASDVLVVVGDIVPRLTERLLRMVEQAVPLLARQPRVLVKPHPNCPVDPGAFPGISFALTSEPMHVILRSGPTVLTSSGTSASVDACCAGVSVIVGLDDDEVNGSPLFGRDDVRFVSGARELASAIDEARAPGSRRDPGECFYLDASMVRWLRLLGN